MAVDHDAARDVASERIYYSLLLCSAIRGVCSMAELLVGRPRPALQLSTFTPDYCSPYILLAWAVFENDYY
jgi:hypothetical protein